MWIETIQNWCEVLSEDLMLFLQGGFCSRLLLPESLEAGEISMPGQKTSACEEAGSSNGEW
jgi:hypothetical protein